MISCMGELQNLSSRRLLQKAREIFAGIYLPDRCHRAAVSTVMFLYRIAVGAWEFEEEEIRYCENIKKELLQKQIGNLPEQQLFFVVFFYDSKYFRAFLSPSIFKMSSLTISFNIRLVVESANPNNSRAALLVMEPFSCLWVMSLRDGFV